MQKYLVGNEKGRTFALALKEERRFDRVLEGAPERRRRLEMLKSRKDLQESKIVFNFAKFFGRTEKRHRDH